MSLRLRTRQWLKQALASAGIERWGASAFAQTGRSWWLACSSAAKTPVHARSHLTQITTCEDEYGKLSRAARPPHRDAGSCRRAASDHRRQAFDRLVLGPRRLWPWPDDRQRQLALPGTPRRGCISTAAGPTNRRQGGISRVIPSGRPLGPILTRGPRGTQLLAPTQTVGVNWGALVRAARQRELRLIWPSRIYRTGVEETIARSIWGEVVTGAGVGAIFGLGLASALTVELQPRRHGGSRPRLPWAACLTAQS